MILLLAAKSVVIAGGTLLVLRVMRGRSAADRSWIAHLGLAAMAALPLGSVLFPSLQVAPFISGETATASSGAAWIGPVAPAPENAAAEPGWAQAADWLLLAYVVVALFLIVRTLRALLRVVLLTARARVVTDDHWLQALTRARRQIGMTKGVALLASRDIASPVSWGVLQPKILLNVDAVAARADADAIVAHELAHVARADWAKLVLARVSVAIFWFNPFAWLLARAAHQLREEAADDAVLAADVEDTTYASLLVSAARNGLLHGAHGVAPARNSLARRVRRVLDRGLNRSAGSTRWVVGMALVAVALTAPLMTLQPADGALASNDDAGMVLIELRAPPPKPKSLPPSTRETGDQAAADGASAAAAAPASIENGL